jgi:hypothetical protein
VCATRLSAVGYILGKWAAVGKTQGREAPRQGGLREEELGGFGGESWQRPQ